MIGLNDSGTSARSVTRIPRSRLFMTRDGKIVEHKYIEHYPPDTTAALFWFKNRRPDRWRDVQHIDAAMGHYMLSETVR